MQKYATIICIHYGNKYSSRAAFFARTRSREGSEVGRAGTGRRQGRATSRTSKTDNENKDNIQNPENIISTFEKPVRTVSWPCQSHLLCSLYHVQTQKGGPTGRPHLSDTRTETFLEIPKRKDEAKTPVSLTCEDIPSQG